MNCRSAMLFFAALISSVLSVSSGSAQVREAVSLDGCWNFATDPDNRGETEKWYEPTAALPAMPLIGYAPEANGKIQVPSIWGNQGYGTETREHRHQFIGKGWYKRQVQIPQAWAKQRAFLVISGVNRYSKVWIDNQFLGEHIGNLSVQEYDVTPYAAAGKTMTVTIQVDSKQRWEVDAMFSCSTYTDIAGGFSDMSWGGIWGHVVLESRSDAWMSDLFVQPNLADSSCSASATLNGRNDLPDAAKLEVFDRDGQRVAETTAPLDSGIATGQAVAVTAPVPDAKLWTPDSPTLYTARLSLLKAGKMVDVVESRFGMRQFTVDGPHLLLNGKRIMLRGYGDDHIYAEQWAMPCDKELHLARLRTIKSYGFNHVRHHSTIMPPEYYEACDELGMICTAEFSICYVHYLAGTGYVWKTSVPPGTDPTPAIETYKREWTAAIKRHRNHPSIFCWVMSNEISEAIPLGVEFQRIARQHDPKRFFADTDGVWACYNGNPGPINILEPKTDRDTLDIYFAMFDVFSDPVNNPDKFRTPGKPLKPIITHEEGNYVTFSRPDQMDLFRHNHKPFWLTAGTAKLEEMGLLKEADGWAEKSERLYTLCHKCNLEGLRKNPYISGYHWWLFQDYYTSSNGIVDVYFRPKSIAKEEVLKFNNDVVLLQDGLQRTYRGKSRLSLKLLVSNFSTEPLQGELAYELKAADRSLATQTLPLRQTPQGDVGEAGQVDVELPDVAAPTKLTLTAKLPVGGKAIANEWTTWLYPAVIGRQTGSVPVFADETQIKAWNELGVKPIPAEGELSESAVYLASWPCGPRVVDAMKRGASVVLLDGGENLLMNSCNVTFRTTWWKAGDSAGANNSGTFVYDHPATRAMAPDGWCNDGWFHLIEGARKWTFDEKLTRPEVIIRALSSMLRLEDQALLFEVGVEKGSLIVSGLNHRSAAGRPENEWLVARLLDHAARLPQPKVKWPATLFAVPSVAPEGCLSGFRRLLANEGEECEWYSFRGDSARAMVCRQTKLGNRVVWETSPLPEEPASDRVTFVFAGGLGFSSEPKTEGFVLEINGKEVLQFDLPEPKTWQSADKRVELRFESRRTVSVDQFGLFYLTVPRDLLKPGAPCILGVRSLGTGSRRWFGLNPYP